MFNALIVGAVVVTIAPLLTTLISGTIIPILTGLVTKSGASDTVKQGVTVVLAGASGLIQGSVIDTGASVFSAETLALAVASWIIAIASYHGVYQSHDINEKLSPDIGLG